MDSKSFGVTDGTLSILIIDSEGMPQSMSKSDDPFDFLLGSTPQGNVPNYIGTLLHYIFLPFKLVLKLVKLIIKCILKIPKLINKLIHLLFGTIHAALITTATALNLPFLMIHGVMVCVLYQRVIEETTGNTT